MDTTSLPAAAGVGRVALRVADLEATTTFYANVLGFEVLDPSSVDPPIDGDRTLHGDGDRTALGDDGDRTVLGVDGEALLVLEGAPNTTPRDPAVAGLYHVAIRVPDRRALGAAVARLRDRSLLDGAADHAVSEAVYLTDPEGNGLELYVDRPRTEWPTAAGGVAMVTDPLDLDELAALAPDAADARGAGDDADPPASLPSGTTVGHVHLEATDLGATRAFYADVLGMNVRQRLGEQALFLAAGDYHHHVGANTWQRRSEPAGDGLGLAWFEVVVPDEDALAAAVERFEANGVAVERPADGVVAVFDPDGMSLRVRADGSRAAPAGR